MEPPASGRFGVVVLALVGVLILSGCQRGGFKAGEEFRDCLDCPVMVVVPAGAFRMGFDGGEEGRPEGPPRDVRIRHAFALGKYEVTQQQFAAFVMDTGHPMRGGCQVWQGEWRTPEDADWTNPGYGRVPFDDEPAACISWNDAQAFVEYLARRTGERYRLPSEAEWEYAARGGTTGDYFWGDPPQGSPAGAPACDFGNVFDESGAKASAFNWAPFACDDGYGQAAPVGSFRPNAFGLHDMLGNVWEWNADCYVAPYPPGPLDGAALQSAHGECAKRVARGGSWITRPSRQRVTFRGRDPPDALYCFFGFRVARDL